MKTLYKRLKPKDPIEKELLNNTELLHELFKGFGNMYDKTYKK